MKSQLRAVSQAVLTKLQGRKPSASSFCRNRFSDPERSFLQQTPPASPRTFHTQPGNPRNGPLGSAGGYRHLPFGPPHTTSDPHLCPAPTTSSQFSSGSVVSDSLRPHELQHARLPGPSPTHRAYSNSCPIESVMPSNHLILCHPLLLSPSIIPSIRVFLNDSVLPIRWPRYWSFSISPSNEYSGLISFRMDWLDLLAV